MPDPRGEEFLGALAGFGRALREAGVPVGTGDVVTYCAAMEPLDPTDLLDLYWAGRTTLLTRVEQIPVYDDTFRHYFLDEPLPPAPRAPFTAASRAAVESSLAMPETEPRPGGEEREREARLGYAASDAATIKHKAFADCSPAELRAVRRIIRRMRLVPPRRRTRRLRVADRGRSPDLRRTLRGAMRHQGDPAELWHRDRRQRPRRLVLVLDVSGSMADHSRQLLQFAHGASRAAQHTEVFCFGSTLTRITRQLEHRRTDDALRAAAERVVDWDGGTRIGASLATLVRDHARRGLTRGAIVVICSDGLDRGDPGELDRALERLSRLCHRIVWVNPHVADPATYSPASLGMAVATPHVDAIASGRDLAGLEELVDVLGALR